MITHSHTHTHICKQNTKIFSSGTLGISEWIILFKSPFLFLFLFVSVQQCIASSHQRPFITPFFFFFFSFLVPIVFYGRNYPCSHHFSYELCNSRSHAHLVPTKLPAANPHQYAIFFFLSTIVRRCCNNCATALTAKKLVDCV